MLTITSEAFHEKLELGNQEIILNGPPQKLRGHILISNKNEDNIRIRTLPLIHQTKNSKLKGGTSQLRLSCSLRPGEERMEPVSHQVNPQTPPGTYESSLMVGGQKRMVKMVIQPNIEINIYPSHFTFQETVPGKIHTVEFTLTNLGNMPFQVPDVKHVAPLDMDFICRAVGFGLREKGSEGFTQVMDEITKNVHNNLADWASASVEEYGKIVAPGQTLSIHMKIILPKNCDPRKDYGGNIRFWNKEITYLIKSHNEK